MKLSQYACQGSCLCGRAPPLRACVGRASRGGRLPRDHARGTPRAELPRPGDRAVGPWPPRSSPPAKPTDVKNNSVRLCYFIVCNDKDGEETSITTPDSMHHDKDGEETSITTPDSMQKIGKLQRPRLKRVGRPQTSFLTTKASPGRTSAGGVSGVGNSGAVRSTLLR